MSIDFCMRINKKCLDGEKIRKNVTEFFNLDSKMITTNRQDEFRINKNGILSIYFGENQTPPMNIYDCYRTFKGEFIFEQLLLAEYDKEFAWPENYAIFVKFGIYMRKKIDCDILITSDCHNEVCLLKKDGVIWADDISFKF